ncbi:MAG: RDD family protein [Pseudobdellovibrionaceae bacterium]|nr:RDD family protein [Pseudomonadota bacterium]
MPDLEDSKNSAHKYKIAPVNDRFIAFVIDLLVFTPLVGLFLAKLYGQLEVIYFLAPDSNEFWALFLVAACFSFVLVTLFQTLSLILIRATPGQWVAKIQIVPAHDTEKGLRFSQAFLRSFLWSLSLLSFGIAFLEVLSHPHRRAFHDRAADTWTITKKQTGDLGPHWIETQFVRQFLLAGALLLTGLSIMGLGSYYRMALQGSFKEQELKEQNYLCQSVSAYLEAGQSRIQKAAALFAAGEVVEECLESEADFVLWAPFHQEKDWAYLAKALMGLGDKEKQNLYFSKACEGNIGEACELSQFLRGITVAESGSSDLFYVLKATYELEQGSFEKLQKTLSYLQEQKGFDSFVSKSLFKATWMDRKNEEAIGFYKNGMIHWSESDRIDLSAWYCLNTRNISCSSDPIKACENLKNLTKGKALTDFPEWMTFALIQNDQCQGQLEARAYLGTVESSALLKDFTQVLIPQSILTHQERISKLKKWLDQGSLSSLWRNQALQMLSRYVQSKEDFQYVLSKVSESQRGDQRKDAIFKNMNRTAQKLNSGELFALLKNSVQESSGLRLPASLEEGK